MRRTANALLFAVALPAFADGVVVVSGRIVSATDAVGTMDFALCTATNWVAWRF